MLDAKLAEHARSPRYRGGRQYGEHAPVTMDDIVKELMRRPTADPRQLDLVPDVRKTG
jgi:hypothetical protein